MASMLGSGTHLRVNNWFNHLTPTPQTSWRQASAVWSPWLQLSAWLAGSGRISHNGCFQVAVLYLPGNYISYDQKLTLGILWLLLVLMAGQAALASFGHTDGGHADRPTAAYFAGGHFSLKKTFLFIYWCLLFEVLKKPVLLQDKSPLW